MASFDRLNYLNMALIGLACVVAYRIPFELFLGLAALLIFLLAYVAPALKIFDAETSGHWQSHKGFSPSTRE